jgi:hypothetical protein
MKTPPRTRPRRTTAALLCAGAAAALYFVALAGAHAQESTSQGEPESLAPASVSPGEPPAPDIGVASAADPADPSQPDPLVVAYMSAMDSKLTHLEDWLSRDDLRSALRLLGELTALVDMAESLGDSDPWRTAMLRLRRSIDALEYEGLVQKGAVQARIQDLAEIRERGEQQPPPRAPRNLVSLMYSLDGILADAKDLSDKNDFVAARRHLAVLADLGRQLSTARRDAYWAPRAEAFMEAAKISSEGTSTDLTEFRQSLRAIQIRCNECHDASS